MTSEPVAQLLLDLGVDHSHSRPRVSNDNPFSEAEFKTLKYAPVFPEAFGSLADARASAHPGCPHVAHPERFGNRRPQAPKLPKAAWINQPSPEALIQTAKRDVPQPA
jgi:putative transposase